ncbi:hypothetical protein P691DRAFT_704304 [Macrolepiota fuliginosa MF-IS2]|uniref:DUF6699 domain-containing protein n=1 Tax=Macrolepiota fuliginosa MF-IS2 TaxID=1400762 RepID=A0A9P5XFF6_9AGAR|nr:hypothetical protein P691DRAFT_704304 [Macrolepiota fuliginosa MF-IS2]
MASYLRSIFWGSSSTSKSNNRQRDASPKSHSRSRSEASTTSSPTKAKHLKYLYAEPGRIPPASLQTTTRERSNSLTAARANAPSPLRYTYDTGAARGHPHAPTHHTSHSLDGTNSKVPLYRTSSHKLGERPALSQYPTFNATSSFGSVRSSNQSVYSANHSAHRYAPSRNSSSGSVTTQSTSNEPKSVLKHNAQHGDNSRSARHAHVSFQNPNRPTPVHMHPLLSYGRIHRAPISYDVIFPPSTRTVVDRHTHTSIPPCTLTQPATEPPTYGRFILKCEKFPWDIIASTGGEIASGSMGRASGKRFYIGTSASGRPRSASSSSSGFPEAVTNLDVLHAIHTALSARVTQAEWDSLGNGSRAQRKATRAYEKRCTDMGGGWGAGVRRVDFLGGKTKLVGIEIATEKIGGEAVTIGKPVFSRP